VLPQNVRLLIKSSWLYFLSSTTATANEQPEDATECQLESEFESELEAESGSLHPTEITLAHAISRTLRDGTGK
jgi:hypothetical protein